MDDEVEDSDQEEKFQYFKKGVFPCLFLIQVQEGFARFEVKDPEALRVLMDYCENKSLQVEWVQAVLNDEFHTNEYQDFPGGKYVAHLLGDEALD